MAAKPTPRMARSRSRIFVVGDNLAFYARLVRWINAEKDLRVCGRVGVGKRASKEIRRLKPDLAVIDLELSEKSALDLIRQVRFLKLPVKLLIVSLNDRGIHAQRVLRAGGDGYILKQEDPLEIINALRDVLHGRLYVSEAVLVSGPLKSRPAKKANPLDQLTEFELEILESLGEGKSNEEMARRLRLTASAVNDRCLQIQHKLELSSMNALVRYAVRLVEKITN